jgi:hypothetical protein
MEWVYNWFMDIQELKQFILEANGKGYATGEEKTRIKENDGSMTIKYSSGEWKMVDNYVGGEPYAGMTKIFFQEKVVWVMVYYGVVDKKVNGFKDVYGFLMKSLLQMPADYPYRGPKEFSEGEWKYVNKWSGEVEQFKGEEKIYLKGETVFWTKYIGGVVDEKRQ